MDAIPVAFVGAGNMACALIGGLTRNGMPPAQIHAVEPSEIARARLLARHGVHARALADPRLRRCALVVWAVKPQVLGEAIEGARTFVPDAVHVSIAAGIGIAQLADWLGSERVVRAMPNMPALVGQGMTGLFAHTAVDEPGRQRAEQVFAPVGQTLWLREERQIDAVTALSGSGPGYLLHVMEAMARGVAGTGLAQEEVRRLVVASFAGTAALAGGSEEAFGALRARVTSKGGTTAAALAVLDQAGAAQAFERAVQAALARATELGATTAAPAAGGGGR